MASFSCSQRLYVSKCLQILTGCLYTRCFVKSWKVRVWTARYVMLRGEEVGLVLWWWVLFCVLGKSDFHQILLVCHYLVGCLEWEWQFLYLKSIFGGSVIHTAVIVSACQGMPDQMLGRHLYLMQLGRKTLWKASFEQVKILPVRAVWSILEELK